MTCVTLQPMMLQVNSHLILHQIIPLQVILHQINLMRFDVWYKDLQLTLDIFGQNRLRSKGWLKQDEDQGAPCVDEDCRHRHHLKAQEIPELQSQAATLETLTSIQGKELGKRSKPILETSSIKANSFETCPKESRSPTSTYLRCARGR